MYGGFALLDHFLSLIFFLFLRNAHWQKFYQGMDDRFLGGTLICKAVGPW